MQSSGGLATRLLTNELNFSLSACFVPFLRHRPSPFLARILYMHDFMPLFLPPQRVIKRKHPRSFLAQEILFLFVQNY